MWAAVTGLAVEARILERRGFRAIATAGAPRRTAEASTQLLADGASGLLSFGIAGALAPDLEPGALLLPRRVLDETGATFDVDPDWHARVLAALGNPPQCRDLLGRTAIATATDEKAALFRSTAAAAIDTESHVVALAARRAGRPFLVLRAIADPADFALPPAALVGLDEHGRAALKPVLRSLLARPRQLGALLRLASDTKLALRALRHAAAAL